MPAFPLAARQELILLQKLYMKHNAEEVGHATCFQYEINKIMLQKNR